MPDIQHENRAIDHLAAIALAHVTEMRRRRRWRQFFISIFLLLIAVFIGSLWWGGQSIGSDGEDIGNGDQRAPHIAEVAIVGVIGVNEDTTAADVVIPLLQQAFANEFSQVILLRLNSPGGSPVQADRIYTAINRLRQQYPSKPVIAVIDDLCASACYYIASAASRIVANQSSLVGSIGVIYQNFGVTDLMAKMGIENRTQTAGQNKAFLSPFLPVSPVHTAHLQQQLDSIHQRFIKAVQHGRGQALTTETDLFNGLIWTGDVSRSIGLIDDFGDVFTLAAEFNINNRVRYTPPISFLDRLSRGFVRYGAMMLENTLFMPGLR